MPADDDELGGDPEPDADDQAAVAEDAAAGAPEGDPGADGGEDAGSPGVEGEGGEEGGGGVEEGDAADALRQLGRRNAARASASALPAITADLRSTAPGGGRGGEYRVTAASRKAGLRDPPTTKIAKQKFVVAPARAIIYALAFKLVVEVRLLYRLTSPLIHRTGRLVLESLLRASFNGL